MSHNLIPKHWSAEEALTVVAFLEKTIGEIWWTHGKVMEGHYSRNEYLVKHAGPVRYSAMPPRSAGGHADDSL